MFDRLGRLVPRLRFLLVAAWVAAAVFFAVFGPSLSQVGSADETSFLPRDAESLAARNVAKAAFPGDAAPGQALIVFQRSGGLTDADRAFIEGLRPYFEGAGHPEAVSRYVTAEKNVQYASMYRSPDGVVELARVDLSTPSFLPKTNEAIDAIRAHIATAISTGVPAGLTAQVTGQAGIGRDYLDAIRQGTDSTTLATIILVVAVLLLIYRAPLAALVPLLTIGAAFLVARGVLGFLAQGGWKLSSVLDSFIVVLVFGVGTDYTIFLVSRFREELARNRFADAIRLTIGRIGAVIAASAATVMVGLCSMAVARFGMIQTTGPALAITIFVALLAGLTLTPSLLAIFGRRLFWPRHEETRTEQDAGKGFWAGLARRITERPGLISGVVLAALLLPLLALPQLRQSFDVLSELPARAESRAGFETLGLHLAKGQLMPLSVLVQVSGGGLDRPDSLTRILALEREIAALGDVQSVRSVVDPFAEGKASDVAKPAVQLASMSSQFGAPAGASLADQLGEKSLAGIQQASRYVGGIGIAYPKLADAAALTGATADLATLEQGIVTGRKVALVANQLDAIAAEITAAASSAASGAASGAAPATSTDTELAALKAYLDELGTAVPAVKSVAAYGTAATALAAVTQSRDPLAAIQLVKALGDLSTWFKAQPSPVYFVPKSIPPTADQLQASQAAAAARERLPGELGTLAAAFGPDDLYASSDLLAAYESPSGDVARLYVTTKTDPYNTLAFETVRQLRTTVAAAGPGFGSGARTFVGGATAEFTDVQTTISQDFIVVAAITIVGILLVLLLLLRSVAAPLYLVLTVLLSYVASLSVSALILQRVFGQSGINYFIPLMVFVLLVALGSDYNIFLMARVREEAAGHGLRPGIRVASARTGTVITSAGLILAGTFGALVTSPLQLLFQVGVAVALGVLVDTFVVRSLLVPAITAFLGEWSWWPSRSGAVGAAGGTAAVAAGMAAGGIAPGGVAPSPAFYMDRAAAPGGSNGHHPNRLSADADRAGHLVWLVPAGVGLIVVAWGVARRSRRRS